MPAAVTYLRVPYAEKDAAKSLGARWDPNERSWYVPSQLETAPFGRWMAQEAPAPATGTNTLEAGAVARGTATRSVLTLSAYLGNAQAVVRQHLSAHVWVAAEIAEGTLRSSHLYLTLAETDSSGGVCTQARAVALGVHRCAWFREFVTIVGQHPAAGMKVLVQVSAELSPRYGFQLRIHSVDASYTLGEFARKLAEIRRQLESEGVLRAQDRLTAPEDFTRVAVISPPTAAGLADFRRDANQLEELGLTRFTYVTSAFQGAETEKQLLAALTQVETLHARQPFDVCIVLRGGGSQVDLDWLNSMPVARAITQASLPIFTAIGHERDRVALDEVSHFSFGTPSKAIGHIRSTVRVRAVAAARDLMRIEKALAARIDRAQARLDREWQRTRVGATDWTAYALGRLQNQYVRVSEAGRKRLQRANDATQALFARAGQRAVQHFAALGTRVASLDGRAMHAARLVRERSETTVNRLVQRVAVAARTLADRAGHGVARSYETSAALARRRTDILERQVAGAFETALSAARRRVDAIHRGVDRTWHAVDRADPEHIMGRGFVLVQQHGRTLTHSSQALGEVVLRWADGTRIAHIDSESGPPATDICEDEHEPE
jgi:exodeoxyribonuclease VII large subunit